MTRQESQRDQIQAALEAGRRLTAMHALREFGCMRLGARIHELKQAGMNIHSGRLDITPKTRVAVYYVPDAAEEGSK